MVDLFDLFVGKIKCIIILIFIVFWVLMYIDFDIYFILKLFYREVLL